MGGSSITPKYIPLISIGHDSRAMITILIVRGHDKTRQQPDRLAGRMGRKFNSAITHRTDQPSSISATPEMAKIFDLIIINAVIVTASDIRYPACPYLR